MFGLQEKKAIFQHLFCCSYHHVIHVKSAVGYLQAIIDYTLTSSPPRSEHYVYRLKDDIQIKEERAVFEVG